MRIQLFDRRALKLLRKRSCDSGKDSDFLCRLAAKSLNNRMKHIRRTFPLCLFIGQGEPGYGNAGRIVRCDYGRPADIEADEELLPLAGESLDACVSNLTLHSVNDLPGTLAQINMALRPDGLFLASMFGGRTLRRLRESLIKAETALHGGASARVFPFAGKQQLACLLQRTGYVMPVTDSEEITVTYKDLTSLLHDLRGMGEGNIIVERDKRYPGKNFFSMAEEIYKDLYAEPDGKLPADFEIIYMIGWKPG